MEEIEFKTDYCLIEKDAEDFLQEYDMQDSSVIDDCRETLSYDGGEYGIES